MRLAPEIFLLLAAIFWGGTFVVIKLALESVPPFLFLAVRFSLAGLIILLLYRKTLFQHSNRKKEYWIPAFFVALAALLGYGFQTVGLVFTTALQSGFLTGAYVIFIPLLQITWERRLPSLQTWVAVFLVVVGLFFVSQNGRTWNEIWTDWNFGIGEIYTLLGAFFFAIYIILIDIYSKKIPVPILVSFEILLIAIVSTFLFPIESLVFKQDLNIQYDWKFFLGVFYTAIFATILTTQIQARYQKLVSPARAGILFSFEPVFSLVLAICILNENLSLLGGIGSFLTLFGIFYSEIGKWNKQTD